MDENNYLVLITTHEIYFRRQKPQLSVLQSPHSFCRVPMSLVVMMCVINSTGSGLLFKIVS